MNHLLTFDASAWAAVETEAMRAFPDECCGFLFGQETEQGRHFSAILPVRNASSGDQRRRFAIHPADYLHAERHALREGMVLLGIYHSHPLHPAVPSIHDLRVALPYLSYLIASTYPEGVERMRSWQLNEAGRFFEEPIQLPLHG